MAQSAGTKFLIFLRMIIDPSMSAATSIQIGVPAISRILPSIEKHRKGILPAPMITIHGTAQIPIGIQIGSNEGVQ